jgi:hypothetical protein
MNLGYQEDGFIRNFTAMVKVIIEQGYPWAVAVVNTEMS